MREIVLDTETTGMDPTDGHRLVEIGCVELDNHLPTGRTFQAYFNPQRDVPFEEIVASYEDEHVMREDETLEQLLKGLHEQNAETLQLFAEEVIPVLRPSRPRSEDIARVV